MTPTKNSSRKLLLITLSVIAALVMAIGGVLWSETQDNRNKCDERDKENGKNHILITSIEDTNHNELMSIVQAIRNDQRILRIMDSLILDKVQKIDKKLGL